MTRIENFVRNPVEMKDVEYLGTNLSVPSNANFISTDQDGEVWVWSSTTAPVSDLCFNSDGYWCNSGGGGVKIGSASVDGDWKDTLLDINKIDLD